MTHREPNLLRVSASQRAAEKQGDAGKILTNVKTLMNMDRDLRSVRTIDLANNVWPFSAGTR